MQLGSRRLAALLVIPAAFLAACSSSSGGSAANSGGASSASSAPSSGGGSSSGGSSSGAPAPVGPGNPTTVGVKVTGAYGKTPTLTIPAKPAPTALTQQILTTGTGAAVASGDTLIANYVGETWAPKDGKPNVFDSSFSRGAPAGFVIGTGQVIPGWDKTLVGKKLGSRVLLTIPPADGYGSAGQSSAGITGTDTLVFVIDLIATYKPSASAPGTVVPNVPTAGLPKITNVPAKPPTIVSVAGVKEPKAPTSTLVVKGSGAKIDSTKTLVLQLVQTDIATGKQTQSTWGQGPQTVPAQNVFNIADKFKGQNIGSRVIALLPATPATAATADQPAQDASPAEILILDVVGQF